MPIVDWGYFLRYLRELNEGGAMNEDKPVLATRKDMAEQALKHYDEVSTEAMHYNSLIPQAIDAWERLPILLNLLKELEWSGTFPKPYCPMCLHFQPVGHADDCELGKELYRVGNNTDWLPD